MADSLTTSFSLQDYRPQQGIIVIGTPDFDFDCFPELAQHLVDLLSARVIEKQWDADIHSWLIDFEGCQLFLKAEHYSECVWLEAVANGESQQELEFLAGLFQRGF